MTIEELLDQLPTLPEFQCNPRRVDPAEVSGREAAVGVRLPADYRRFLLRFGFASWDGRAVAGIFAGAEADFPPSYSFAVVEWTARFRSEAEPPFDATLGQSVVIGHDQSGGWIALLGDAAGQPGGVVYHHPEDGPDPVQTWPSFTAHLADRVRLVP